MILELLMKDWSDGHQQYASMTAWAAGLIKHKWLQMGVLPASDSSMMLH